MNSLLVAQQGCSRIIFTQANRNTKGAINKWIREHEESKLPQDIRRLAMSREIIEKWDEQVYIPLAEGAITTAMEKAEMRMYNEGELKAQLPAQSSS